MCFDPASTPHLFNPRAFYCSRLQKDSSSSVSFSRASGSSSPSVFPQSSRARYSRAHAFDAALARGNRGLPPSRAQKIPHSSLCSVASFDIPAVAAPSRRFDVERHKSLWEGRPLRRRTVEIVRCAGASKQYFGSSFAGSVSSRPCVFPRVSGAAASGQGLARPRLAGCQRKPCAVNVRQFSPRARCCCRDNRRRCSSFSSFFLTVAAGWRRSVARSRRQTATAYRSRS